MPRNLESAIRVVRCFVYARISEDREGAHLAVERQLEDCTDLARQLSTPQTEYRIVAVFPDNDLSAYTGKPRPEYKAMLEALRAGEADCVLSWHTDRLHRSPVELEEYIDVCSPAGIDTRTVKAGHLDLSTATGRMIARQLGVQARYEVERMIERSKRARDQKATLGEYSGGPRPFGYEADGVTPRTLECSSCGTCGPDGFRKQQWCEACENTDCFTRNLACTKCDGTETLRVFHLCDTCGKRATFLAGSEAAVIRDAAPAILSGASLNSLATAAVRAGMSTSQGKVQRGPNLRAVLLRPRNAGLIKHRGDIAGRADWAALLDEPTWRSMVALLLDPSRIPSVPNTRKHLGSNIYECGVCAATLKASSKSSRRGGATRAVYRCRNKDCVTRDLPDLDAYVMLHVIDRLTRADAVDLLTPRETPVDVRALQEEITGARRRLDELAAELGSGAMDLQEWRAASRPAKERLKRAEEQMSSAVKGNPVADLVRSGDPVAMWNSPGFDLSRKRAAVDYLVAVTVHPARRGRRPGGSYFDGETVQVEWK